MRYGKSNLAKFAKNREIWKTTSSLGACSSALERNFKKHDSFSTWAPLHSRIDRIFPDCRIWPGALAKYSQNWLFNGGYIRGPYLLHPLVYCQNVNKPMIRLRFATRFYTDSHHRYLPFTPGLWKFLAKISWKIGQLWEAISPSLKIFVIENFVLCKRQ